MTIPICYGKLIGMEEKYILSYMAGLFDGEGSICIGVTPPRQKNGTKSPMHHLVVSITMTDEPTIKWIHSLFGGSIATSKNSPSAIRAKKRPCYMWRVWGNMANDFLQQILPYSRYKKDQVLLAIEFQNRRRGSQGYGYHKLTDKIIKEREEYRNKLRSMTNGRMSPFRIKK